MERWCCQYVRVIVRNCGVVCTELRNSVTTYVACQNINHNECADYSAMSYSTDLSSTFLYVEVCLIVKASHTRRGTGLEPLALGEVLDLGCTSAHEAIFSWLDTL